MIFIKKVLFVIALIIFSTSLFGCNNSNVIYDVKKFDVNNKDTQLNLAPKTIYKSNVIDLKITDSLVINKDGLIEIDIDIKNNKNKKITVRAQKIFVNDIEIKGVFIDDVNPLETKNSELFIEIEDLIDKNIEKINKIVLDIHVEDYGSVGEGGEEYIESKLVSLN